MEQFDPNIPDLMEGAVTRVVVTEPQPFKYGLPNHVIDPTKPFDLTIEWEIFGQLVPLWLSALAGEWEVSVFAESLGPGPEILLGKATVPTGQTVPVDPKEPVDPKKPNLTKYSVTIVVKENTLPEFKPEKDMGETGTAGIYKLATAVFLDSKIESTPGFDLVGYSEGPVIQAEEPH
jgi:hypothetical protein